MMPLPPRVTLFPYTTLFRSAIILLSVLRIRQAPGLSSSGLGSSLGSASGDAASGLSSSLVSGLAGGLTNRSEEHTSELQSLRHLVCRLLLEKKKQDSITHSS